MKVITEMRHPHSICYLCFYYVLTVTYSQGPRELFLLYAIVRLIHASWR